MPVISRLISIPLRIAEIAFAAVVAGIIGHYLASFNYSYDYIDPSPPARWIYVEVIAGISILFGLLWLIPFSAGFFSWPLDILISFAWFAAFGILVNAINYMPCGSIWSWGFGGGDPLCARWKAAEAFSFMSAIFWIFSAIIGIWFTFRKRGDRTERSEPTHARWGRPGSEPAAPGPVTA